MYISSFWIFLFSVCFLWLWLKIKAIENKQKLSNTSTTLTIHPNANFYNISMIQNLVDINPKEKRGKFSELTEKSYKKLRNFINSNKNLLSIYFRFFYEKRLVFYNGRWGNIPSRNEEIYIVELGETKDGKTVEFIIKQRYLKNILKDKDVSVYSGYLKREKKFTSKEKDKEIFILFDFPEMFINPSFFIPRDLDENTIRVLEKKCELNKIENHDFSVYTGDLGKKEYFLGAPTYYEGKYFNFHI